MGGTAQRMSMAAAAAFLWLGSSAVAQDTVKLGFFGPLTDRFAALGLDAKKGADLALKQVNAAGGVNGRKIELIAYDDAATVPRPSRSPAS